MSSSQNIECGMDGYIGIDCGSSSIKIAIINKKKELIDSVYIKNKGVFQTLQEAFMKLNKNYNIKTIGCTGSGRNLIKFLVGADLVKTEILAHATATLSFYPNVKTICDIGAEDSKIIGINEGIINNFYMNSICSAGCGAMLEAIAVRIGIKIEDVGHIALKSKNRVNIPSKCGVFAQSAVVTLLNKGVNKEDILMGVCRGLIHNYLLIAKGGILRSPIVFQGMTAKNKALVKAMKEEFKSQIIVPDNCELMGAIGMAIIAMESNLEKTQFKGFDIKYENFKTKNIIAKGCENNCEITLIYDNKNKFIGCIGNRCEKCYPKIK